MESMDRRMDRGFDADDGRFSSLEQQQAALAERLARLEGLME